MSFVDDITQFWVRNTGKKFDTLPSWLVPVRGASVKTGESILTDLGFKNKSQNGTSEGLLDDPALVFGDGVDEPILDFYRYTSMHKLDVSVHWNYLFYPIGFFLKWIFSERLGQLNMPVSSTELSNGVKSEVVNFRGVDGLNHVFWVRRNSLGNIIFSGRYDVVDIDGKPHVRVVFPLPNGNATVILEVVQVNDGGVMLSSSSREFGQSGFYFSVLDRPIKVIRKVNSMKENLTLSTQGEQIIGDHVFTFWGMRFVSLKYIIKKEAPTELSGAS